ncbi:hypothetical protein RhiirA5_428123 [Rhizophagus irregularis]|uniref:Uncharacterized protein n=1 Tax=Rhizophagus irregularis TaxID=588596 RepID=A0A2N0P0Y7_9GLOM|nr:hypothetical protein RhiirA5_428123 [Rhizophagus irregularis]
MVNNTSLTPIKQQIIDGDIDWTFTKEWLNHNPTDAPCSAKLSKRQGARLKKCNFIYPTIDIQQQHVNEKDHALEETINSSRLFDKFYRRRYHSNDNSSPPDNIQSDSTLRRTYTHRQIPTIPYSRTGEFYNNEVHIRWTSSNFLHSRPWTTHRDNFWFDNIDLFSSFNYNIIGNYINTR